MLTLKDALAHSQNPVALRLAEMTGTQSVIQTARDLGVTEEIPQVYQWLLGASDITIYEMVVLTVLLPTMETTTNRK
jgi:penicillin-binding protein 1A